MTASNPAPHTVNGTSGCEILLGSIREDAITGFENADVLAGYGSNDRLDGGDGDDILMGGAGADTMIGGRGFDYISYIDAEDGVTVSLARPFLNTGEAAGDSYLDGIAYEPVGHGDVIDPPGNDGDDLDDDIIVQPGGIAVSTCEGVVGSWHADVIMGDDGFNVLFGLSGGDLIVGGGSLDVMFGGDGNDTLIGGAGIDQLVGGAGADVFVLDDFARTPDAIWDFESVDRISISTAAYGLDLAGFQAIDPLERLFTGDAATAAHAQFLLFADDGGNLMLHLDLDGTGAMRAMHLITFAGTPTVGLDQLILV